MTKIWIVGLWYVWLPLAYNFDKVGHEVIGYDISGTKINALRQGVDLTNEIWDIIGETSIDFVMDLHKLALCEVLVITVPTPIDKQKNPDFWPLISASKSVWEILQKDQIVVYESTVYPWCTEEICIPELEKASHLSCPDDFQVGYSPERINPWDTLHTVDKITKVVAWIDKKTAETLWALYETIITAWIHIAPTIKVAEAAKVIENTQRDINIAFMNELSTLFDKLDINTQEVLKAAWTKRNFLNFYPWLVWGHCIWVDPYRLAYKAEQVGHDADLILAWRRVNDNLPFHVAQKIVDWLISVGHPVKWATVLVFWLTFKPNVPDFRNSKIADTLKKLWAYGMKITWHDPYCKHLNKEMLEGLGVHETSMLGDVEDTYDVVIMNSFHNEYEDIRVSEYMHENTVLFDISWKLEDKKFINYYSL